MSIAAIRSPAKAPGLLSHYIHKYNPFRQPMLADSTITYSNHAAVYIIEILMNEMQTR